MKTFRWHLLRFQTIMFLGRDGTVRWHTCLEMRCGISIHLLLSGAIQNLGQGHSAPSNTFTIIGYMTRRNNSPTKAERCVGFLKRTIQISFLDPPYYSTKIVFLILLVWIHNKTLHRLLSCGMHLRGMGSEISIFAIISVLCTETRGCNSLRRIWPLNCRKLKVR